MSISFYTLGPGNSFIQGVLHQFHFTPFVQIIHLHRVFFINFTLHIQSRLFVYTGCSSSISLYTFGPDYSFIQNVLHQFHFTTAVQNIRLYRVFCINFALHLRSRLFVYAGCLSISLYTFGPDYSFIQDVSSCPCARHLYRLEGLRPPGHSQRLAVLGKPG